MRPKGTPSGPPNINRIFQNNRVSLCPPDRQISGWYEELRAQYPNPQPYSGLALSRLSLGGQSHTSGTQGDPIRASKSQKYSQNFYLTANNCKNAGKCAKNVLLFPIMLDSGPLTSKLQQLFIQNTLSSQKKIESKSFFDFLSRVE